MTYLIPEESNEQGGSEHEAWNIAMSLVYHFGCDSGRTYCNPFRPLFDVADNGTLITQRAGTIPAP